MIQRAGLESAKPIDVFRVKPRDKGKPEAEAPLAAYRVVAAQRRKGLYAMPCAADAADALRMLT